jgi:hypothetical protein
MWARWMTAGAERGRVARAVRAARVAMTTRPASTAAAADD